MTAGDIQTPTISHSSRLSRLVPAGVLAAAVGVGVGVLLGSSGGPTQTQPSLAPASPSKISSAAVAQISSPVQLPWLRVKPHEPTTTALTAGTTDFSAGTTQSSSSGTGSAGTSPGKTKTNTATNKTSSTVVEP
jgi:hypothetical protein